MCSSYRFLSHHLRLPEARERQRRRHRRPGARHPSAPVVRSPRARSRQARRSPCEDPQHTQARAQARARPRHAEGPSLPQASPAADAPGQALRVAPDLLRRRPALTIRIYSRYRCR